MTVLPRSSFGLERGRGEENPGGERFGRQVALFSQAGTTSPRELELVRLLNPSPCCEGQTGERP